MQVSLFLLSIWGLFSHGLIRSVSGFSVHVVLSSKRRRIITNALTTLSASTVEQTDQATDVQKILGILEKRIEQGPGCLSVAETRDFEACSNRILEQMKQSEGTINHIAVPRTKPMEDLTQYYEVLHEAATRMDATAVTRLVESGMTMNEETTDAAFWAVVNAVNTAEKLDKPLSADVPIMLHHIFDADLQHLLSREKITKNVTCMQPAEEDIEGRARRMGYIFDDMSHRDLPLSEGRKCEDGNCCDACSRNIFPTFCSEAECSFETFPELASLTFNELETVSAATILQFTRLVERVRRTMAHEYGLDLSTLLPLQAYSRKYVAGTTQQGGGGGEGDHVTLHTDEATHSGYHYSSVLYLSTQGEDFQGGDFVFNDPKKKDALENEEEKKREKAELEKMPLYEQIRRAGRLLTPFHPKRGSAVIFSSGWENMHEVEQITSGTRYAVPCFFTTCPVPQAAYDQMKVGKPKSYDDIADDWLHLLLAHREETPVESVGRVKELLMKWHYLCTPLDQH